MTDTNIRLLTSEADWKAAAAILADLRKDLSIDDLLDNRLKLIDSGYRLFGLFSGDKLITVAGVTISPHLTRIKDFWLHDFVTTEERRTLGYGTKMIRFLQNLAMEEGFGRVCLYTQVNNNLSQDFYDNKVSFDKYGYMYVKEIKL